MRYLILIVFSLISITGRAADEFRAMPLTLEDIVSIYKVPVEERPSYKCEWTLEREKYVQCVLEETEPLTERWKSNGTYHWTISSSTPCTMPVKVATCIYTIENRAYKKDGRNFWQINLRFGGTRSSVNTWKTYSRILELPETAYTITRSTKESGVDPISEGVVVFIFEGMVNQGPSKIYRLRLESSDRPFPGK